MRLIWGRSASNQWWVFGPTRSGRTEDGVRTEWSTCAGVYLPFFYVVVLWNIKVEPTKGRAT